MSGRKWVIGVILIVLGLILLGRTLGFFYVSFSQLLGYIFPLFLIALGLYLLARSRGREQAAQAGASGGAPSSVASAGSPSARTTPPGMPSAGVTPLPPPAAESGRVSASPESGKDERKKYNKFIGDMYVDCSGIDLQNVEISSFIGDVEVKLHGGKLAPGLNRMIISGFIGDVRVLVPDGMAVLAQSSSFIGDIEMMGRRSSGFGNSLDAQTNGYTEAEAKLYIATNHFIGDVRVYVV